MDLTERLAALAKATGLLRFSEYMEAALYDEVGGFYASGGQAGRRGDFLTSPEVGPLFGAVLARAIDEWWRELGEPATFTVVDAGAGPGTLARTVLAAPVCEVRDAGALRYVTVERSDAQRANHPAGVLALDDLPDEPFTGVIVANELLDNLPFDIAVYDGGWRCAGVAERDGRLVEVLAPIPPDLAPLAALLPATAAHGSRAPLASGAARWLRTALDRVERGRVVVIDYGASTGELAARPWRDWLRTYRGHERGVHPLSEPGSQDITTDVPFDQLAKVVAPPVRVCPQRVFLTGHGIDGLVAEGLQLWAERAHLGDLAALKARSRVRESEALMDPDGLGGFTVAEWVI